MKVFVIGGLTQETGTDAKEKEIVKRCMTEIGRALASAGHDLLICSPFPGSADLEVIRGAATTVENDRGLTVEVHYPSADNVAREVRRLRKSLSLPRVQEHAHPAPKDDTGKVQWTLAWLLAQLSALDRSNAVIALGGKSAGSASLLLLLAEARRKTVLPFPFLGGAAAQSFARKRYELEDRLGQRVRMLEDANQVGEVVGLLEQLVGNQRAQSGQSRAQRFFISYARTRPQEADFVEMILRRRNYFVFRDERDFGAGPSSLW